MNARQSARAASKQIEALEQRIKEIEHVNRLNKADIVAYNQCIDSMIAGGSPCEWCYDNQECTKEEKGSGCNEWMIKDTKVGEEHETDHDGGPDVPGADDGGAGESREDGLGAVPAGQSSEYPIEGLGAE